MPDLILPPDTFTDVMRARLPLSEQLMEVFSDALVSVSDALDIARCASSDSQVTPMLTRIQSVYDELNSMMKELAD